MTADKSISAFYEEENEDRGEIEKEVDFEFRCILFRDGTTAIEPQEGFEYSEPKTFQTLSEILSWMNSQRTARTAALFTQDQEQSSKQS